MKTIIEEVNLQNETFKRANQEILVRFYPNSKDRSNHKLLSLNTLRNEIGDAFVEQFTTKFLSGQNQKQVFKLRRGIEIVLWFR